MAWVLDDKTAADLRAMLRWWRGFRGPGVANGTSGAFVSRQEVLLREIAKNPNRIRMGRITSSSATATNDTNGNPVRWTYGIEEITKSTTGYGGWVSLTNGYSGTGAYHGGEDGNDGTGRQMNGVDHDGTDYPSTFKMYPLQTGLLPVPFILTAVPNGSTMTIEAWILPFSNGEDGPCS